MVVCFDAKSLEHSKATMEKDSTAKSGATDRSVFAPNHEVRTMRIPHGSAKCSGLHSHYLHKEKSKHHGGKVKVGVKEEMQCIEVLQFQEK